MPLITSYSGTTLLESSTLEEIKKQADFLLKNKDVAGAWQASQHIKKELSTLPAEKISIFLTEYRKITANLKALAFPILEKEEAFNLLEHNLAFVSSEYLPSLKAALYAWVDFQENPQETKEKVLKLLESAGTVGVQLKTSLFGSEAKTEPAPGKKIELVPSYEMFNEKERDELVAHVQLVNKIGPSSLATGGAVSVVDKIFLSARPNVDKESFARRAQALIASRLRDVRTPVQLSEYLSRPFAVGGLGLEGGVLKEALDLIEQEYNKLHSRAPIAAPVSKPPTSPLADELEEKEDLEIKPLPVALAPVPTPKPVPTPAAEPVLAPAQSVFERPRDVKQAEVAAQEIATPLPKKEAAQNLAQVRNLAGSEKSRLSDIKSPAMAAPARTLSAADELKLVSLNDFRGWGDSASATGEIMRRVGLLAKESLGSKMQGIKMFRSSELFKDYVRIGQASLSAGKKLAEVLSDSQTNPNKMTEEEFFAVASLNSKLK